jgi:pyrimidine operon attenuation protein/uracil phosphoribosyltransferase
MQVLLSPQQLDLTIKRLCYQLLENDDNLSDVVFVGIQPRGVQISNRIIDFISEISNSEKPSYGLLDITFYRDDIREELHIPKETTLTQSIEGKKVILIDDVLYTGRTIRAALDALQDFGRPQKVMLCVLVNRRFNRELPIQPDFYGIAIDTTASQKVKVDNENNRVILY